MMTMLSNLPLPFMFLYYLNNNIFFFRISILFLYFHIEWLAIFFEFPLYIFLYPPPAKENFCAPSYYIHEI